MAYVFERHQSGTVLHIVRDIAGTGTVTGVTDWSGTVVLRDGAGDSLSPAQRTALGFAITEQGTSGYYDVTFTPDAAGNWFLSITNPGSPFAPGGSDEATYDYPIQVVLSAAGQSPSGTFLTTLANLKEQLGISGTNTTYPDAYLNNVIARASQRVERIVGRPLVQASYTEYRDGDGTRHLNLRRGPVQSITSVSSVTYATDATETATALDLGNYFVRGDESDWFLPGYLEMNGSSWTRGQRNYKVVYTAGFASVPYDLEAAALHAAVAFLNKRKDAATSSRDIGAGSVGTFRDEKELDEELRAMVAGYIDQRVT